MIHGRDGDPTERTTLHILRPARRTQAPAAGGSTSAAPDAAQADAALEPEARDETSRTETRNDDRPDRHRPAGAADQPQPPRPDASAPAPRSRLGRGPALTVGGLALAVVAGAAAFLYLDHAAHFQSTDDAFAAARQFSIAPKVGGYVASVPVTDNQHVEAGGLIARIDDRDYRVALAQAEAQAAAAEAGVRTVDAQIAAQQAQIVAAQAQVTQARAALVFAEQQADRYEQLQRSGSGTVLSAQQSSSQLNQQRAAVAAAEATLQLAERQVEALKAQRASAEANVKLAEAQRDLAGLNLSYAAVTAAQPGRVVNLSAAVGQLAQPGAALASFVPDEIWITANFKETQLDAMRPGEPVEITLDASPERALHGRVASVQPGSGTAFSLLPPENATGNYVKIVQRVPVKIVVDDLPATVTLGPGMSVVPTVRTNPAPSLYERLKAALGPDRSRS